MSVAPEIIGRDEELGAVRAFISRVGDGPGALVLSGEAGIGKTILWEAGVEEARERFGRVLTCRGVEAEASFPLPGLSELLAGVVREVAPDARAASSPCARGGAAARGARRHGSRRTRRSGLPCSMCCRRSQTTAAPFSSRSTTLSGSTRPRPPCCRSRFGVFAMSGSACWRRSGWGPRSRVPSSSSALLPGRAAGAALARPAHARRAASFARGAARARADPTRARPRAGGDGRESLLRARAGARARAHGHAADAGTGLARSRQPARAARRPSRPPAYPHRRCPAPSRGARPADGRARRGSAWRPRASVWRRSRRPFDEGIGRARRLARSLCASLARLDLLTGKRRSGSAVPCIARSQTW